MPTHPTNSRCPCCGRARRPRAKIIQPAPLLDWIERQKAVERARRSVAPGARLMLRADLRDADGPPRVCVVIPGRRAPLAFPTITAALAALQRMEAAHAGR